MIVKNLRLIVVGCSLIGVVGSTACKQRTSISTSKGSPEAGASAAVAMSRLSEARTRIKTAIAKFLQSKPTNPADSRQFLYNIAKTIQEEYSDVSQGDLPFFYSLVSPEERQIFDLFEMKVPPQCDPAKTPAGNLMPAADYLYGSPDAPFIKIEGTAESVAAKLDKNSDAIFDKMSALITAYSKNAPAEQLTSLDGDKPLADRLNVVHANVKLLVRNFSFSQPSLLDTRGQRTLLYQLAEQIQWQYRRIPGRGDPDFYAIVSQEHRRLFDLLGMELPSICDPTITPITALQSPETYLIQSGTFSRVPLKNSFAESVSSIDKNSEAIYGKILSLVQAYSTQARDSKIPELPESTPAARLNQAHLNINKMIANLSFSQSNTFDVSTQRALVYDLITKVQQQYQDVKTKNKNQPDLYAVVSPDDSQLFDLLGMQVPDVCNRSKTSPQRFQTQETYLAGNGTFSNIPLKSTFTDTLAGIQKNSDVIFSKISKLISESKTN